jgi:hypothetical protein
MKSPSTSGLTRTILAAAAALAGCTTERAPGPQETVEAPTQEPLPTAWVGAFTMVQAPPGVHEQAQFHLALSLPNRFRARRDCHVYEGRLEPAGEFWHVRPDGPIKADQACVEQSRGHAQGVPEGLFPHRTIRFSLEGGQRWIIEGDKRWLYIQNPAAPPRAPIPPGPSPQTSGRSYLAERYGISEEESQRRLRNETHVGSLAQSLRLRPLPGFSDIWIEHEPLYGVIVAFKGVPPRAEVLNRAHASLRSDIVFRTAKRDHSEIERDQDRIIAVLQPAPGGWAGGYNVKNEKFEFTFASPAGVAFAERRIPADLRSDVVLRVGAIPQPLSR